MKSATNPGRPKAFFALARSSWLPPSALPFAALAGGLLAAAAGAGEPGEIPFSILGRRMLACPVCRRDFEAVTCPQSNARGGVDRDLFTRALGPQPEFYRVSTCPGCGYSGYDADFDPAVSLSPEFRARVLQSPKLALPVGFGPRSDPRTLDAADRYALAVQCYEWRRQSDESLAWLHLRASWVAREEGSVLPADDRLARVFTFAQRWRPVLDDGDNQADGELRTVAQLIEAQATGRFNRYQRPYVELAAALILRRHGENPSALVILDRWAGAEPFSAELRAGLERMRDSIAQERAQQRRAAECFERALLAGQIGPENRGPASYLLGELYRRLGREREALTWYQRALDTPHLPASLRVWIGEQQAACGTRPA